MAKLVGISGLTAGREYELSEISILGRSPNANVRLPDLSVSRHHAKITHQGQSFVIEDLASAGGTLVNNHYITVSHLRPGDELAISDFRFRFVDGEAEPRSTAEFSVVLDDNQSRIVSVDAARFTRVEPLESARAGQTVERLARRLNAVLVVGQAASSSPDARHLLDRVMEHCLQVFPQASRALVAVPDRERQNLVVEAMGRRQGVSTELFSLSRSMMAEVLYKGRSIITNAPSQTGQLPLGDVSSGAVMVTPLICHGQMLGLIYIDQLSDMEPPFTEEDLEVLTGMAAHVALALHSAKLKHSVLQQSRTDQELAAAQEVQKRFLPRGLPKLTGFSFVAHYDPCRDVGGDLYDFVVLDPARLGIVIGDVSGKGFAAAIVMAWIASQLRVAAHQERAPADVVARVNESLIDAHQDDLFVTLIYGVLNRVTRKFHFCNAGHVPPLVRRRNGQVEVIEEGTGLPVGVVADATFEEHSVGLDQGDVLLLVTDGVTEAMSQQRTMFGINGLADAMAHGADDATRLVSDVLGALRAHVDGNTQYDDITLVAAGASSDDLTSTVPPGKMHAKDFVG